MTTAIEIEVVEDAAGSRPANRFGVWTLIVLGTIVMIFAP